MVPGVTEQTFASADAGSAPVKPTSRAPATDAPKPHWPLTELEKQELKITERYAAHDRFVGYKDMPFHPWGDTLELKPLRFDNRTGTFVNILANRTDKPAALGKHRHRGQVTAVTLRGSWWYEEYDWRATAGDYVVESPGTIHTLHLGPQTEIVFTVTGSLEFYHADNSLSHIMDLFSYAKLYLDDCEKNGTKPDDTLWF